MFTAWDYPFVVIAVFFGALALARFIMQAGSAKARPDFECEVCGRIVQSRAAREWRYCPYCGVPRDARELSALPRKKSILDIE